IRAIVLHESGHNWGLQHNFIASQAYSAADVRSKAFTSKYGLANSVMEYTPTNVWPKGMSTGDFFQTVLGPYDYYAIKWGYAPIPGATTPQSEVRALSAMASSWSDPKYRFAMDEDVQYENGHAIDPRVSQFDLTNDNLGWCASQLEISDTLMRRIESRFTRAGDTHDALREAFGAALYPLRNCTAIAAHYVAGEQLSRAHIGDRGATPPLSPVPRAQAQRAYALLDARLFAPNVMSVAPSLLRKMVYTEWVTDLPSAGWAYSPPVRHDVPVSTIVEEYQQRVLDELFDPVVLQRLADLPLKYAPGTTMSLTDVFAWTQKSIFGDIASGRIAKADEIHRSLQQSYARMLAQMLLAPAPETPYDARSLARAELVALSADVAKARSRRDFDLLTRAHIAALGAVATDALTARTVVPAANANANANANDL
ncbi:MAG: zinc-dependent metalloprotease, partial [Candidatus Eremiobacteraeota bacterium]|nr:zinc-dependent metalloprotease [Candidatus Eremiobacteraeota bacterium]